MTARACGEMYEFSKDSVSPTVLSLKHWNRRDTSSHNDLVTDGQKKNTLLKWFDFYRSKEQFYFLQFRSKYKVLVFLLFECRDARHVAASLSHFHVFSSFTLQLPKNPVCFMLTVNE